MDNNKVQLVIKNPTTVGDHRLEFPLSSTVGELKNQLYAEYTNNPLPSTQKLIFAGRLLQDNSTLDDVFKQHDITVPQTLHLVVRSTPATPTPSNPAPNPNANPQNAQENPPNVPPPFNNPPNPHGAFQFPLPPGFQPFGQGFGPAFNPQVVPQHGYYYPPQFAPQNFIPFNANPAFQNFPHQGFNFPRPQNQNQQPQNVNPNLQQPQQQQQAQNANNNNNNNNGEGQGFGLLIKLGVLVLIFSQSLASKRTAILTVLALLYFLYHTGRLRIFFRVRTIPNPALNNNNNNANNNNNDNNNENNAGPNAVEGQQQQRVSPGFVGEVVNFVVPFFMSLFPTYRPGQQPVADNNIIVND
eukprot:TRINITY_DN1088_c0_g1_i1.p1 TRINITY_DN1088_c0_g1~~TRINITY_DN1088_c0_g1_i1.p1  ORF type:complete len:356 (+),score=109.09 TRINITY_DN1088_c0_g1_i1:202-1269(+)